MAWPLLGARCDPGLQGRAVLVLYLPPPEGESETGRRAQRLKAQPVRAGHRPPRSGALEKASTSPTLSRPSGPLLTSGSTDTSAPADGWNARPRIGGLPRRPTAGSALSPAPPSSW